MSHELEIIEKAIDKLLLDKRAAREAEKLEQYGGSVKTAFYASELGDGERKLVYKWFADRIGDPSGVTAKSCRIFDNGDYVHLRYRDYMIAIGALLSEEQPIKADQFEVVGFNEGGEESNPWRVSGRYDQIIDLNVVRAYVEGKDQWLAFLNENYEQHVHKTTTVDEKTGATVEESSQVRWVPKEGYEPDQAILDIKSQNEWGFNRVEKGDYSDIQGYFDQLSYYEHQKGIHKGALVIEDKSKQRLKVVPVDYDQARVLGNEDQEGLVGRLERIWNHVKNETVPAERCEGANRNKFPCLWSTGQCDFYHHCWSDEHQGLVIPGAEEEPELPSIEELIEYLTDKEYGVSAIVLYLKDFPGGQDRVTLTAEMPQPMIETMLDFYADYVSDLDYLDDKGEKIKTTTDEEEEAAESTDIHTEDSIMDREPQWRENAAPAETTEEAEGSTEPNLYNSDGTLNFDDVEKQAIERVRDDGDKAIHCVACDFEIVYKKCYGGIKPCPKCGHKNSVQRA